MKRLLSRFGVRVLTQLGLELGHEPHPALAPYVAGHPVTVINGRLNARRFIVSNPGGSQ